jgi:hypothetical protein
VHSWDGGDGTELNADLPMTYEFWSGEELGTVRQSLIAGATGGGAELTEFTVGPSVRTNRFIVIPGEVVLPWPSGIAPHYAGRWAARRCAARGGGRR